MKRLLIAVLLLLSASCAKKEYDLVPGANGTDGKNGHSLVSQYMAATELECDANGGSRLDIYIDLDDSLTPSDGDRYQNSIVACNGLNGLNGTDGTDGTNGNNGINGHDGIAGPPGQSGPPGLNGNPGHDGQPGPSGPPGQDGSPGSNGHDGAPGQDGKDAHVTPKNVTATCSVITANYSALVKSNTVEIYNGATCAGQKVFVLTSSASTFWLSLTELAVFVDPAGLRILTYGN